MPLHPAQREGPEGILHEEADGVGCDVGALEGRDGHDANLDAQVRRRRVEIHHDSRHFLFIAVGINCGRGALGEDGEEDCGADNTYARAFEKVVHELRDGRVWTRGVVCVQVRMSDGRVEKGRCMFRRLRV